MFFLFRIPVATLAYLIPETCEGIFTALKGTYLKVGFLNNNVTPQWVKLFQFKTIACRSDK